MYLLSFGKWSNAGGIFFHRDRLYTLRGQWTPVVKVTKRYKSWFGFFHKPSNAAGG
ncbi:hypothetical protein LCGC14_2129480 [marine sediment metagenome]|uniref:Uncharacterized protein n=1 Tax=marine sediment metagenome TaxID=412755 RepID=A0A0F9GY11_9ZZZZ